MKKLSILLLSIFCIAALASCDKEEMGPVISSNPTSPSITSPDPGSSYSLSSDQADDTLMTMEWTKPDYGFSSAPTFTIQMAPTGQNFENPIQLATVNGTSYSITVEDMNSILIANGFPADLSSQFDFRVMASVGNVDETQVSDPITLAMTPFPPFPSIYASGNYQSSSGYDIAPALVSQDRNNTYEGYVYFAENNSQFTFTSLRGSGTSWGDDGGDGTLEEGGAQIEITDSGYYRFIVNLDDMTYSMTQTQWGVIGSATADGWSSDQDMTYNMQNHVWEVTLDLTAGEIKFRPNDTWNLFDYGDDENDGFLDVYGANIPVSSGGNYTITLDLEGYFRTYELSQN